MANPYGGEVELKLDGKTHVLKLTLGALAELESELQEDNVVELITRFEGGRICARDVTALIVAGLRGGGWRGDAADLISVEIEGGVTEAVRAAAQLLVRAFEIPKGRTG